MLTSSATSSRSISSPLGVLTTTNVLLVWLWAGSMLPDVGIDAKEVTAFEGSQLASGCDGDTDVLILGNVSHR